MPSAKYDVRATPKPGGFQKFYTKKQWTSPNKNTAKNGPEKYVPRSERVYQNVEINSKSEQNNVTLIEVPYNKEESNKLKIVIQNFDKILSEFGEESIKAKPQKYPLKLQKSKTCSIIESKCILKKSLSNPTVLDTDNVQKSNLENHLTKSLSNMDFDADIPKFDTSYIPRKHVVKSDTFTKSSKVTPRIASRTNSRSNLAVPKSAEVLKTKNVDKPPKTAPKTQNIKAQGSNERNKITPRSNKPVRLVKSYSVSKLNEDDVKSPFPVKLRKVPKVDSSKPAPNLSETNLKPSSFKKRSSIEGQNLSPRTTLCKAKSSWDVSMSKKPSKIPIKALSKNLSPSIPNDLNHLDRKIESAPTVLQVNISKLSNKTNHNLQMVKNVARNISDYDNQTLDKCLNTGQRILKKVEQLTDTPKKHGDERATNLIDKIKKFEDAEEAVEDKISVKNVIAKLESVTKAEQKSNKTNDKIESKPANNPQKDDFKFEISKTGTLKINKNKFGELKNDCRTLFENKIDNKRSYIIEDLKHEIKTAKEIIHSVNYMSCEKTTTEFFEQSQIVIQDLDLKVNRNDPVNLESKILDSDLDEFEKLEQKFKNADKTKDYNSDCSDDSGNISNDHDLDCDIEEEILVITPEDTAVDTERKLEVCAQIKPHFKSEVT